MSFKLFSQSASQIEYVSFAGLLCPAPAMAIEQVPASYDVWDFGNFYEVWDDFYVVTKSTELVTAEAVEAQLLLPAVAADAETRRVEARQAKYAAAMELAAKARKVTVVATSVVDDSAVLVAEANDKLAEQQRQSLIHWSKVRRDSNRAGFTLGAVTDMIAALRTGTTRKTVGGKGFTATTIAAQQGDSSMSTNIQSRYSRRVNQSLARNKRANRQRRNGRRYISPITSQQRKANRLALAARQERRAKRRLLAKVIASERMVTLGVVTRTTKALCASIVPKPIHFSKKVFTKTSCERPVLFGQPARKMTAMDFRRRYAEDGAYHRKADVRAAMRALNPDYDPDLWRASRVEVAPQPFSQESAIVAAEAQATLVMANTASKYAGAVGMTMMLSDDTMTAGKQADTNSVRHNKANKQADTVGGAVTEPNRDKLFKLLDAAIEAGGQPACFIQMDSTKSTTGDVVALYSYINASDLKVISNLYPKDDINPFTESDCFYQKPEHTEGKSWTHGAGNTGSRTKDDVAVEYSQVGFTAVRALACAHKDDPIKGEIASLCEWVSIFYRTNNLLAKQADGGYVSVDNRDVCIIPNLPGRQTREATGNPGVSITAPRQYMRNMIFNGSATIGRHTNKFLKANPNFDINVVTPLNKLVANGEGFHYNRKDTGVHVALVIAEIAKDSDDHNDIEFWQSTPDSEGQCRMYASKLAIVYMPVSAAMKFVDTTPSSGMYNEYNTGMWPRFDQKPCRQVKWEKLAEYMAKMPDPNNKWTKYESLCLPNLGDLVIAHKQPTVVSAPPAATTTAVVEDTVVDTSSVASKVQDLFLIKDVAAELDAYDAAKQKALRGKAVKNIDAEAFALSDEVLTLVEEVNEDDFEKCYANGALAVAAAAGKMAEVKDGQVICKGYHWEVSHLQTLLDALALAAEGGLVKVTDTEDSKTYSISDYFQLKDDGNGEHTLWMGGTPAFRFLANRMVLEIKRGRIFHHTVEMHYVDQVASSLTCDIADSFSNFMHYFVNGVMLLMGAYFDAAVDANFLQNCLAFLAQMPSVKMSSDKWEGENGARGMLMQHTYVPVISYAVPFLTEGKMPALGAGARDLANLQKGYEKLNVYKAPTEYNPDKTKESALNDMNTSLMERIIGELYLESHFTKACYLPFGAVNIGLVQQHCPKLFAYAQQVLGECFNANEVAMVVIMTLKATKGLKRLSLWMAKAARPADPRNAGYRLRNQHLRTVGTAVNVMLAPSLVGPPGQNYIVNPEKLIEAYVDKTETNYKVKSFKVPEDATHPFNFIISGCASIRENTWTVENRGDEYVYVVPEKAAFIEGRKPLLFHVCTDDMNATSANDVYHEHNYEGQLNWVRFKVENTVVRDIANLVVEYEVTWKEGDGKLRSINKCQAIRCNSKLVRNKFNPSLEGIEFDMVCTQDALKLDVLYGMLTLIGNTVNSNVKAGVTSKKITDLYEMVVAVNTVTGYKTDAADPVLWIDEVAMVCGLYQNLLDYFEANFLHPHGIWFDWQRATEQARIVYNIYKNKVADKKGWVQEYKLWKLFPELKNIAAPANSKIVCYREAGEITNKTNIFVFVLDANGMPTRYLQRTYVFVGDQECTLTNIELYESSTVQESVSNSYIRMPEVVGIEPAIVTADPDKDPEKYAAQLKLALDVQIEMLQGGRKSMLQFASIAYADAGASVFDGMVNVNIYQSGINLTFGNITDVETIWATLNAAGITKEALADPLNDNFKAVCHALCAFNFSLPKAVVKFDGSEDDGWDDGYCGEESDDDGCNYEDDDCVVAPSGSSTFCLWLPALYSFTKLTSRNENNLDFVSKFYKEILKPLLFGQQPQAINAKQCYSVMSSLLRSKDFIKLPSGKRNLTAKRVALGDVRCGEMHLLVSSRCNSAYQLARRVGFDMEAFLNEALGHQARAPISNGYIAKFVIRRNVKHVDLDGNVTIKQMIYRIGEDGKPETPVEAWYYLSDVQIGLDVFLPTCYDRGDFDGDGHYSTRIETAGVVANTWDDGVNILNSASALDLFDANNDSYFCDHYGVKSYAKAMKTLGSGIVDAITHKEKGTIISVSHHAENNASAIMIQHGAVGVAYAVYMIGMIMTNLCSFLATSVKTMEIDGVKGLDLLDPVMRVLAKPGAKSLVGVVSEMYEIMLGGPDKGPEMYRSHILESVLVGSRFHSVKLEDTEENKSHNEMVEQNLADLELVMKELKLKVDNVADVAAIVEMTSIYYSIKKNYEFVNNGNWFALRDWVAIATFMFELGRGKFNGFKGVGRADGSFTKDKLAKAKALAYQNCAAAAFTYMDSVLGNLVNHNVYVYALNDLNQTVGSIIKSTQDEIKAIKWKNTDCLFFVDACSSAVEDEPAEEKENGVTSKDISVDDLEDDDDNNGNYVTPVTDDDGDDDGGAEAEVGDTEAETAEQTSADSTTESAEPTGAELSETYEEDDAYDDNLDDCWDYDDEEEDCYDPGFIDVDSEPVSITKEGEPVAEKAAEPAEVQQVCSDAISLIEQVEAMFGGDTTIKQAKQLLQQLNSVKHNKVNKQDDVVIKDVPDMKEIIEEQVAQPSMNEETTPAQAPSRGGVVKQEVNQIEKEEETLETVKAPARVTEEVKVEPVEPSAHQIAKVQGLVSKVNEEQLVVVQTVGTQCRNVGLTGEGGAGKSFTVNTIRDCFNVLNYPHWDLGSTGTSVVNIQGDNTFNGMFGLGKGFDDDDYINRTEEQWLDLVNRCYQSKQISKRLVQVKAQIAKHQRPLLIIVDEVSMMDSLLLSAVEEALNQLELPHYWLLVGDPMQFEPVNGHQFFKDVKVTKADGSVVIKKSIWNDPALNFCGFNLKNNMRAKGDSVWSEALRAIRMHHYQNDLPEIVKERWAYSMNNPVPKDALVLTPTNKTVKRFNDAATRKLIKAGAQAKEYTGSIDPKIKEEGKAEGYWVSNFEPISLKMIICKGMRVMLRETNLKDRNGDIEVNNGQTGTVLHLGEKFVKVKFDNGVTKDITPIDMEDAQGRGTFTQIPLVPAYALTISKAQGMTFDVPVVFHMYTETKTNKVMPVMMENAFYVALSRLTTSDNCYFETGVSGVDRKGNKLEPYQVLLDSYITNEESLKFTYTLK